MNQNKDITRFVIQEISSEELNRVQMIHFNNSFANRINVSVPNDISVAHAAKIRSRESQRWELRLGIYDGEAIVGWHVGYATDAETFYMQNSVVLEPYRRLGVYSLMLNNILLRLREEGFQVLTSLHHPNNAAVIIPKLKRQFIITGSQFNERFRFLIEMKYFFSDERRRNYSKEIGLELP